MSKFVITLFLITFIFIFSMCEEDSAREMQYSNTCVPDVMGAFDMINTQATKLAANSDLIEYPYYSFNLAHNFGDNHFQGIQRVSNNNYLVVTGSHIDGMGDIFFIKLGSRDKIGPLLSNLDEAGAAPAEDLFINNIKIGDDILWHAGGFSIVGDILIVPVEDYRDIISSKIMFYNIYDPENPVLYDHFIDRTQGNIIDKAGAVAMTRLPDNRFLLASRTDSYTTFYLSSSANFEDGFDDTTAVIFDESTTQAAEGVEPSPLQGQSVNFINQCDGQLYIAGFNAVGDITSAVSPDVPCVHTIALYQVEFADDDYTQLPVITKVAEKEMFPDGYGHFAAGVGVYVDSSGTLSVYSCNYYIESEHANFQEGDTGALKISEFWEQ